MTRNAIAQRLLAANLSASLIVLTAAPLALAADNPYGYVSAGNASSVSTPVATVANASTGTYGTAAPVTSYNYPTTSTATTGSYGTSAYGTNASAYPSTSAYTTSSPSYPSTSNTYSTYGTTDYSSTNPYATSAPVNSTYSAPTTSYGSSYGAASSYGTSGYPDTLRGGITTIPQGTVIMTRLNAPVTSATAQTGDPVSGTVEADIYNGTQLVVPSGSTLIGSITDVTPAGRVGKNGSMGLQFNVIRRPDGSTIPFQGHLVTESDDGVLKGGTTQSRVISTAIPAVGGAAAGTVLGAATGGLLGVTGSGAGTGLAIGTIAGVSYALIRKGKQVALPTGSRLSVMVDQPVAVN